MILWTVQDIAVWEQLEKTGLYTVPAELIVFPKRDDDACNHMNYAYRWLANQMSKLVGPPPEGVEYPIWAWYKRQGRHDGKPDMRQYHHAEGGQCVRMKLDVPDWEVLRPTSTTGIMRLTTGIYRRMRRMTANSMNGLRLSGLVFAISATGICVLRNYRRFGRKSRAAGSA